MDVRNVARFVLAASALATPLPAISQSAAALPTYQPRRQVSGVIRVWGHGNREINYTGSLLDSLQAGFRKFQPRITLENGLLGNASAIGGLYTGAADIALMDRRIWAIELDGYQQVFNYDPAEISIATGNLKTAGHAPALVIFVAEANPIKGFTITQLDAIFGADHRRGSRNINTWGELGLTGEWASQPIIPYGYNIARKESQAFEKTVLKGSQKWNCNFRGFSDEKRAPIGSPRAGQRILDELAKDPSGIAFSTMEYSSPGVRPVGISQQDAGPFVMPTVESLQARTYPLVQTVSIFFNHPPGKPIDPKVQEFLTFLLSREGQGVIAADGGYLPLTGDVAQQERAKIQ
ncbi:MAG TPA: substrate-binding domain-containing protein [Acidobacteriaceae bacterium]|jgi:phosphate transport system substrate-binding protein